MFFGQIKPEVGSVKEAGPAPSAPPFGSNICSPFEASSPAPRTLSQVHNREAEAAHPKIADAFPDAGLACIYVYAYIGAHMEDGRRGPAFN